MSVHLQIRGQICHPKPAVITDVPSLQLQLWDFSLVPADELYIRQRILIGILNGRFCTDRVDMTDKEVIPFPRGI